MLAAVMVSAAPAMAASIPQSSASPPLSTVDADCLSLAIYYEARSESREGQEAVAQVVLNRLRDPAYPKDVCSVVFQGSQRRTGCQFSFTCDGSMSRLPKRETWNRAREIAAAVLAGRSSALVGNATHYHTTAINPYWSSSLSKVATIGAHVFYSKPGASVAYAGAVREVSIVVGVILGPRAERQLRPMIDFDRSERVFLTVEGAANAGDGAQLTEVVTVHRGSLPSVR